MKYLLKLSSVFAIFLFASCEQKEAQKVTRNADEGFNKFIKNYNRFISEMLVQQKNDLDTKATKLNEQLAKATDVAAKKSIESKLADLKRSQEKVAYRQSHDGYFMIKSEADIPDDLVWENGMGNPIIGDPKAKKGGSFNTYITDFPETLRPFGPNSNGGFRGEVYDNIDMGLVGLHPLTNKFYPALAKEWAFGKDGRTMFYRLDPDATYSDGVNVKARDFMFGLYVRLSDNVSTPFQKQWFKEQLANVTSYGDQVLSISIPEPKPLLPLSATCSPAPPHFYNEYGPDYEDRYQWKVPPTTGAYTLLPENIKKGRSLTLTRVKDWWAKDKKFFKHAYNVDKIKYQVIAERSKAFELFLIGEIDTFPLSSPDYWYEKMEVSQYFNGYIEKVQFYNVFPRVPRGFYLNLAKKPLDNLDVRLGLAHSFNFKKANTILYRGDASRLKQFSDGFGEFTNPNIEPREFSIAKAVKYFAKAGYKKRDDKGYLINQKGERLRVEITWPKGRPIHDQMMSKLKESAKKAGVEILLDGQPSTVAFGKMLDKNHKAAFVGWGVQPPFPRYYQFFHSKNAYDEKGNIKPQTNNMNSYSNERMDKLCEIVRGAKTKQELRKAAWEVQQIAHDEGLFIPAFKTAYVRMGNWRWVKWPQTKLYEFCSPKSYYPTESYLYWVDEDVKKETLEAKKAGKELPEMNHFFDLYRNGVPKIKELEKRPLKN